MVIDAVGKTGINSVGAGTESVPIVSPATLNKKYDRQMEFMFGKIGETTKQINNLISMLNNDMTASSSVLLPCPVSVPAPMSTPPASNITKMERCLKN